MRTKSLAAAATLAAALPLAVSGVTASAAPPTTYSGQFLGNIIYDCDQPPPDAATTGTWSVRLQGVSAKATFDIYVNDAPHVAYTYPGMKQQTVDGATFSVTGRTAAGPLTVTLTGNKLTYTIAPYDYNGLSCDSVTYPGVLGSGS